MDENLVQQNNVEGDSNKQGLSTGGKIALGLVVIIAVKEAVKGVKKLYAWGKNKHQEHKAKKAAAKSNEETKTEE